MSKINDGGPAFPTTWDANHNAALQTQDGMSLRDWFAGQVLASAAALPIGLADCAFRARLAYQMADAMLAARLSQEGE